MPSLWPARKTNSESSISSGKGGWGNVCMVCYGPPSHFLSHSTCPGPGGYRPGGSINPHGLNYAVAPNDFTTPDHIKHVGIWNRCGVNKTWLPVPWPRSFRENTFQQSEPPPYLAADGGEKAAKGAAGGSRAGSGGKS